MRDRTIRMVVTDLDGTLLRDDKTISAYTEGVIGRMRGRGVKFALATARPIRSVRGFLPGFGFDGAVYHNGAVIEQDGALREGFGIAGPLAVVRRILADDPGARVAVEASDVLYSNFDTAGIWPGVGYTPTEDFRVVERLTADKIIVEARTLRELDAVRRSLPEELYAQLSEHRIAMIMNRQATKTNGIRLLAARWGIAMEQIAAFGDDYNDIDMLKSCGVGVAVENALDEVKAAADEICQSNEADGVARWLEGLPKA